jgi:acyl-CoA synthetase (AMP-forming)/AMP-acid ligase II
MVSTGAALVSGARLALADRFKAGDFWQDVRRYGATVVFYCGEMGRELLNVPPTSEDRSHPIRLFCGSGMRADTWRKIRRRFGSVSVIETYGSTEGKAVLANVTGEKTGSIGRPIPGSAQTALVRYDFEAGELETDQNGQLMPCGVDELGVLVSEVTRDMPVTLFEGYAEARPDQQRLIKGAFESGDTWFNSHDVLRRDSGDDFWYVGSLSDMIQTAQGPVSTREIEEALCHLDSVCMATIWTDSGSSDELVGALSLMNGATLDTDQVTSALSKFGDDTHPSRIHLLDALPVTEGFRPLKGAARLDLEHARAELVYDADSARYVEIEAP